MCDLYLHNQQTPDQNEAVPKPKKGTRGGWRPGAGRKPVLEDPVSFTGDIEGADFDALAKIAEQRRVSLASLVRAAVSAYLARQKRK